MMSTTTTTDSSAAHTEPPPLLALPAPEDINRAITLDCSTGEAVTLDAMGPVVVNSDGTLSRITNWDRMEDSEKAVAKRRICKRNVERLRAFHARGELKDSVVSALLPTELAPVVGAVSFEFNAVDEGAGRAPKCSANLAAAIAAAPSAGNRNFWGHGDFELHLQAVPRADAAAAALMAPRKPHTDRDYEDEITDRDYEEEMERATAALAGQTPAAFFGDLTGDLHIFEEPGGESHTPFVVSLLPTSERDAPIVEGFELEVEDGEGRARFATAAFAFLFEYVTS